MSHGRGMERGKSQATYKCSYDGRSGNTEMGNMKLSAEKGSLNVVRKKDLRN